MPESVIMLIESSIISHNTSNFVGAMANLEKARVINKLFIHITINYCL